METTPSSLLGARLTLSTQMTIWTRYVSVSFLSAGPLVLLQIQFVENVLNTLPRVL